VISALISFSAVVTIPLLSSFRPFLELVSILLFLLGPEMLKNADSPRLERGKSPLELRTLLKSQPDNLYASSPPRRDPWPQGTQCTWFPGHPAKQQT